MPSKVRGDDVVIGGRHRSYLAGCLLLLFAAPSVAGPADALDIYVVRGEASQLERFQSEIGKGWQGGEFLDRLSSGSEHRYWAYSTRTASQAREFMFGSMSHQLAFDIEAYDQSVYYPKDRKLLDDIAGHCGATADLFFIQPDRTLVLKPGPEEKYQIVDCLLTEVKKAAGVNDMPMGFVGNAAPAENDK